jgi:hypothetical protein
MKTLCQHFMQNHAQTLCTARITSAAVVILLAGTQVLPARGADTAPGGSVAPPVAARPAGNSIIAQPMPAALETLIRDFRKARSACAADIIPAGFVSHVTKRGETAKMIIRQYWADLPLKEDFLKALIARMNPETPAKAFSGSLKAGTLLTLPSAAVINAVLFNQPEPGAGKPGESDLQLAPHSEGNFAAGWVQFP